MYEYTRGGGLLVVLVALVVLVVLVGAGGAGWWSVGAGKRSAFEEY